MLPRSAIELEYKLPKTSREFRLYLRIISSYSDLLQRIRRDPKTLETLQSLRLGKIIRIADHAPWWNRHFQKNSVAPSSIKKVADLSHITPITRLDVVDVPREQLLTRPVNQKRIQVNSTSGSSTGTPFFIVFNRSVSVLDVTGQYVRIMQDYGFPFQSQNRKNFLVHFNFFGGVKTLTTAPEQFATPTALKHVDAEEIRMREICKTMSDIGPCVLLTHPSELFFFIQKLKEYGLHPPIKLCMTIGQMLEQEVRQLAEEYLLCPAVSIYGLREEMLIASACKDHPYLLHPFAERAIIEIVDARGNTAPNGEFGEMTITGLDNFLMPLIRYQPGDIARFRPDLSCSCVNQTPLFEIERKQSEVFVFDKEVKPVRRIARLFGVEPLVSEVKRFQIQQEDPVSIRILIEVRHPERGPELSAMTSNLIRSIGYLPPNVAVHVDVVDAIEHEDSKYKMFVPLQKWEQSAIVRNQPA